MFDIGFGEMILLAAIALIAIGPKQLPEVARAVGKLIGEFKRTVGDVTSTMATARNETDKALRQVSDDLAESIRAAQHAKPIQPVPDHPGEDVAQVQPAPSAEVPPTEEVSAGDPSIVEKKPS
jgi:sec-independent protein translocase protein TatB